MIGIGIISQLIHTDIQKYFSFVFSSNHYSSNKSKVRTNGIIRNYSKELNGIESQDYLEVFKLFFYQKDVKL